MSNFELQEFESVFISTFPTEIAELLLHELETNYGSLFGEKYGGFEQAVLILQIRKTLNGITPQDLKTGLNRMYSEKWCPTLPEFRSWCVADSWWTANEAWAKATQYLDYPKTEITDLTKQALDSVHLIITNEGQKSAGFAFRDIYNRLLNDAKSSGKQQTIYDRKKNKSDQYALPLGTKNPHDDFTDDERAIFQRQKDFINGGMDPRLAHQQALKEYYALKGENFGPTNKMQQLAKAEKSQSKITPYHQLIQNGMDPVEAFKTITRGRA